MKFLVSIIAMISFSQVVLAEVKMNGTVLSRLCGQVERDENVITIENTPRSVCLSKIQGVAGEFIVVKPNLGPSDVYAIVSRENEVSNEENLYKTEHQLRYVGTVGPKGMLVHGNPFGMNFERAQLISTKAGGDVQILQLALAAQGEVILVNELQVMFHTMSVQPSIPLI